MFVLLYRTLNQKVLCISVSRIDNSILYIYIYIYIYILCYVLSVLFSPQYIIIISSCTFGQMEGVTASSIVDDVNLRSNESDGRPQLLLYVILKHMLSEDDYLQLVFVQFSLLFPKKTTMLLPIEAGRRFQAMIKVDRTT